MAQKTLAQFKENLFFAYTDMVDNGELNKGEFPSNDEMMNLIRETMGSYIEFDVNSMVELSKGERDILNYAKNMICGLYQEETTPKKIIEDLKKFMSEGLEFATDFEEVGGYEAYKLLKNAIQKGLNLDTGAYAPQTPLQSAIIKNSVYKVSMLLDSGVDVNRTCSNGKTALAYAIEYPEEDGEVEILTRLLEAGADRTCVDVEGTTAVEYAVSKNALTALKLFVETGSVIEGKLDTPKEVSVDFMENIGFELPETLNVMTHAMLMGRDDMLDYMLSHKTPVDTPDNWGNTPLSYAVVLEDHLSSVKKLIRSGADVNHKNKEGYTPLMIAVLNGNYSAFMTLLNTKKVNLKLKNNKGQTVESIVRNLTTLYPFAERLTEYKKQKPVLPEPKRISTHLNKLNSQQMQNQRG